MFPFCFFIYHLSIIQISGRSYCFFQLSKNLVDKKGLVVETSPDLIYILPYYSSLVHVFCNFYLTKINLFISIPYPNQVYDKQRKKYLSCPEILIFQDGAL